MKCSKCGNDYPSNYYFATENVCNECYKKLSPEEQQIANNNLLQIFPENINEIRIGFWRRFGASLLDYLIITILFILFAFITGKMEDITALGEMFKTDLMAAQEFIKEITLLSVVISLIYSSTEAIFGFSAGKLILGIRIANQNGTKATISSLFYRFILKHSSNVLSLLYAITSLMALSLLSSVLSLAVIIGFLFVISEKRLALHDIIAKTAVYYTEDIKENN